MPYTWFKWDNGTSSDKKFRTIAGVAERPKHEVIALWAAILEHASAQDTRGNLDRFDISESAADLDISPEAGKAILAAMIRRELLVHNDGCLFVAAWERRNVDPGPSSGAERTRRYRARKKGACAAAQAPITATALGDAGDGSNTLVTSQQGNVTSHVTGVTHGDVTAESDKSVTDMKKVTSQASRVTSQPSKVTSPVTQIRQDKIRKEKRRTTKQASSAARAPAREGEAAGPEYEPETPCEPEGRLLAKVDKQESEGVFLAYISAFDAIRVEVWGSAKGRPYPMPDDATFARKYYDLGIPLDLAKQEFLRAQTAKKSAGDIPINALKWFDGKFSEWVSKGHQHHSPVDEFQNRVQKYRETGKWEDRWGPVPLFRKRERSD